MVCSGGSSSAPTGRLTLKGGGGGLQMGVGGTVELKLNRKKTDSNGGGVATP